MIINITNTKTSKLGFGKELRKEVAGKVEEAKKVKGNKRLEVVLRGADTVIESGNKKALELLRDRIDHVLEVNVGRGCKGWKDQSTQLLI